MVRDPMPLPKLHLHVSLALASAALLALGCGGGGEGDSEAATAEPVTAEADFPSAEGRTLIDIGSLATPNENLVVLPAGQAFEPGENRLGFGVFTVENEPIRDAEVAIYTASKPGEPAHGPFPATVHSLETPPAYRAESTSADPDAAEVVYTSQIEVPDQRQLWMLALVETESGFEAARLPTIPVGRFDVPRPGEKAPLIHTPTADDVGGKLSEIDTRNPPSTQHEDDLADVLGEQPAVLLFATPALCQSRVCGPVVDIAEQVKDETEADVSFIHMEIFKNNEFDPENRRPQVVAYNLFSEPWLFVIDDEGRISTAIEGAFGPDELREAIAAVS